MPEPAIPAAPEGPNTCQQVPGSYLGVSEDSLTSLKRSGLELADNVKIGYRLKGLHAKTLPKPDSSPRKAFDAYTAPNAQHSKS